MSSMNPFDNPNSNKSLPPIPHSRSHSSVSFQTPLHLRSGTPLDPFLDSAASPLSSKNEAALPRLLFEESRREGLPREETFQSTTESLVGITTSAHSLSEYETEYGYTESDLHHASTSQGSVEAEVEHDMGRCLLGAPGRYTRSELGVTEGDLQLAPQSYTEENLESVPHGLTVEDLRLSAPGDLQTSLNFSDIDLHTPSQETRQAELVDSENRSQAPTDTETLPVRRPIRILLEDVNLPLPTPQTNSLSGKSTLMGTYQNRSTVTSAVNNPFSDPPRTHFSSPATDITPVRALPNSPYTPSNLGTHPALRHLAGGYHSQGNLSTFSLNREVRLREAAKQQDLLLKHERKNDDETRIPLHAVPTLRPSPVALKVAAQLIRDSPAGKLPIGPQAVLHSRTFWSGLSIFQIGLVSMTAAITKIVYNGDIYQNVPQGANEDIFWLTLSIVALLGGGIIAAITFLRKMGYWIDKQQLLGLDEVGLVDRLLRRDRTPRREAELGMLHGSVQTFASATTTPRPREGLYAAPGRFDCSTFNSLNPEWQELYMTPEQLQQKISLCNINTVDLTPSKVSTGTRNANGLLSSGTSLEDFNQASPEPLQPAYFYLPGTPNPFQTHPEPPTPYIPASTNFSPPTAESSANSSHNNNAARESVRVEVDNWSPLENLTRDINSEHVRNMPIRFRHEYISEQRLNSEDRTRRIRESLERETTRSNSDVTSVRPATISEDTEKRRSHVCGSIKRFEIMIPEAQQGEVIGVDGVEMEMEEWKAATATCSSPEAEGKTEGEQRQEQSGGSVNKMKKMLSKGKTGFRELDGKNVSKGVREKIERLREQSERAQKQN